MTAEDREIQRKRLLYRSTHRGTKEADAILGGFVTAHVASLSDEQLDALESLLERPDPDLMDWLRGRRPISLNDEADAAFAMLSLIKDYQQGLLTD